MKNIYIIIVLFFLWIIVFLTEECPDCHFFFNWTFRENEVFATGATYVLLVFGDDFEICPNENQAWVLENSTCLFNVSKWYPGNIHDTLGLYAEHIMCVFLSIFWSN